MFVFYLIMFCSLANGQDLFLSIRDSNFAPGAKAQQNDKCQKKLETVSTAVANQGKFAVWHDLLQVLLWVDSPAFTPAWAGSVIYAFKPKENKTFTVTTFDADIVGSVMPRKAGGVVLAVSKPSGDGYISSFMTMDVDEVTLKGSNLVHLYTLPAGTKGKFNNGNCDPAGRYWVGTFDYGHESESQGKVWVLQRNGQSHDLSIGIDGISHPNGLIWSPDGAHLLFSETWRNVVYKYNYSVSRGTLESAPAVLVSAEPGELIDSMCGLQDGSFYVTEPGSGQLRYYSRDGVPVCVLAIPDISASKFVASCAFGGGDMYIPTGRNGGSSSGPAGWLFRMSQVVGGITPSVCDI